MKSFLKKYTILRVPAKWVRRIFFKSKLIYFLRSTTVPLSDYYGLDRGAPIDRYYIERFLNEYRENIRGRCLELLNNEYTKKYGDSRVTQSDILDIDETNVDANIIGDLRNLTNIADNTYDCIILTQVLQFIDDVDAAIKECYRILKPNGTVLVTLPSVSRVDCIAGVQGDYWRFTQASATYLFHNVFNAGACHIQSYGNVRAGIFFLAGVAQEDISKKIMIDNNENFPLLISVIAVK